MILWRSVAVPVMGSPGPDATRGEDSAKAPRRAGGAATAHPLVLDQYAYLSKRSTRLPMFARKCGPCRPGANDGVMGKGCRKFALVDASAGVRRPTGEYKAGDWLKRNHRKQPFAVRCTHRLIEPNTKSYANFDLDVDVAALLTADFGQGLDNVAGSMR